jgi:hypothetical protein
MASIFESLVMLLEAKDKHLLLFFVPVTPYTFEDCRAIV